MAVSLTEVEGILASARDRYLVLLLTEKSQAIPKVKPGIPALSYRVLDRLIEEGGPLDETLKNWSNQRPSRVIYKRLLIDRNDSKVTTTLGVCWMPQVRLIRKDRVLLRSSVSIGDNGEFLAQDVGGRSLRPRGPDSEEFINLLDALSDVVDKPRR